MRAEDSATPPAGTVTMLFTDVEGSTRLAQELGVAWPAVLAAHRALVRDAIAAAGGYISVTEGDSFFATFPDASAAARVAAAAQRALRSHRWPEAVGELRVRMGLHSGAIEHTDGHYVGLEVHRAARVAAAAHGGQVILTAATRAQLEPDLVCEDLGSHRLKDFPEPLALFHLQIDADRPAAAFPAPRTLDVRPTNLPSDDRPLIGREAELAHVRQAFLGEGARLVTLTGLGGMGKTRTALAAAASLMDEHRGGVWLVRGEGLRAAAELVPAIAGVLHVRDVPGTDLGGAVAARLESLPTLLVLDNLEHLAGADAVVADLLARGTALRVLATSRAPLRLAGEWIVALGPLADEEAAALFAARAHAADPGLSLGSSENQAAVAELCRRLDCLPLALELAAARLRLLTPSQLADRLRSALELHGTEADRPQRHRSLRATIEWSLELLPPYAQSLFARLAVFSGAVPLELLEEVCGDGIDVIEAAGALVDFSLLRRVDSGLVLVAALREVATERMAASGEEPELRRAHAQAVAAAGEGVRTLAQAGRPARELVQTLHDDTWAAVGWARGADPALHRRIVVNLAQWWAFHGQLRRALAESELALLRADAPPAERGELLLRHGHLLVLSGREDEGVAVAERGAALLADRTTRTRGEVCLMLCLLRAAARQHEAAVAAGHEAVACIRVDGTPVQLLHALAVLAQALIEGGDAASAEPLLDEAEALAPRVDTIQAELMLGYRADWALASGDPARALAAEAAGLRIAAREDLTLDAWSIACIVRALADLGEAAAALELATALELVAAEQGLGIDVLTSPHGAVPAAIARAREALSPDAAAAAESAGRALAPGDRAARALALADECSDRHVRSGPLVVRARYE